MIKWSNYLIEILAVDFLTEVAIDRIHVLVSPVSQNTLAIWQLTIQSLFLTLSVHVFFERVTKSVVYK